MLIRSMILASVLVTGIAHAVEVPNPLDQERAKARPLVIVARTERDPTLFTLKKSLEDPAKKKAFDERNMVLYTIVGITGQRDGKDLEPQSTMSLIRGLKPGMIIDKAKVFLIGKDGEIKYKSEGEADLDTLFKTVDALPPAEKTLQAQAQPEPAGTPGTPNKSGKPAKPAKPVKALED